MVQEFVQFYKSLLRTDSSGVRFPPQECLHLDTYEVKASKRHDHADGYCLHELKNLLLLINVEFLRLEQVDRVLGSECHKAQQESLESHAMSPDVLQYLLQVSYFPSART